MPEARTHDRSTIQFEVHGAGPTVMLPVNPRPVEGPQADEMRTWGADPALGSSLIRGLSDVMRVVAFDYQGHVLATPRPETLTPATVVSDVLAVADAAGADRFAWYGYSWLAVIGLQLAVRTDRLWALAMGGFPPLGGPYREMLRVTEASAVLAASQSAAGPSGSDAPRQAQASTTDLSVDQTRQFITFYQALQGFDDRAAQARVTCPRLCFVGSADEMRYPPAFGDVHLSLAGPIVAGRTELEGLGWDVRVLDGLDHLQAMLPGRVLPMLRPWLLAAAAPLRRA
jgi:pimeloyl-ACP methyl ester carboxylesterase